MIPSCSHTGVPGLFFLTHFTVSTTSGSASWMSLRILLKVSPRQSASSAILLSICADADWSAVEPDFFMCLFYPTLRARSHERSSPNRTRHWHVFAFKAHRLRTQKEAPPMQLTSRLALGTAGAAIAGVVVLAAFGGSGTTHTAAPAAAM